MKLKRILKFYFSAEKLNRTLDGMITRIALSSADCSVSAESCAEKICEVIATKKDFSALYNYINGIMCKFTADEAATLKFYANLRTGILKLPDGVRREIKRVLTAFSRKSKGLERFERGLKAVDAYYAVM